MYAVAVNGEPAVAFASGSAGAEFPLADALPIFSGAGELVVSDTHAALCRCGGSPTNPVATIRIKPLALLRRTLSPSRSHHRNIAGM